MTVAEAVKALRKHLGLSQQAFGTRLGFSIASIQNYEGGKRPAISALLRLAQLADSVGQMEIRNVFQDALLSELGFTAFVQCVSIRQEGLFVATASYIGDGTDAVIAFLMNASEVLRAAHIPDTQASSIELMREFNRRFEAKQRKAKGK